MDYQTQRQLMRSRNGVFAGVCSGLAEYFGMNLTFVRLTFVISTLLYGIGPFLYLLLLVVMPQEPAIHSTVTSSQQQAPPRQRRVVGYIMAVVTLTSTLATFLANLSTICDKINVCLLPSSTHIETTTQPSNLQSSLPVLDDPYGTYYTNITSDTDPELILTAINIGSDYTKIYLRLINASNDAQKRAQIYPPGTQQSFYLASSDGTQVYPLRDVTGIPTVPDVITLEPGDVYEFVLWFDQIDANVQQLDLIEGVLDDPDMTEWVFWNISLTQ